MTSIEFERFIAECLDPDTEAGRRMLTPTRVRTPQDLELAQQAAKLMSHRSGAKPIAVESPAFLPPCF
jgi:hypothetical protein